MPYITVDKKRFDMKFDLVSLPPDAMRVYCLSEYNGQKLIDAVQRLQRETNNSQIKLREDDGFTYSVGNASIRVGRFHTFAGEYSVIISGNVSQLNNVLQIIESDRT